MREECFNKIKEAVNKFKYSSMRYIEYNDIHDYEVCLENVNIILIYGFNVEANINEYHWAANNVEDLINVLKNKKDFLITFIPNEWIFRLEEAEFIVRNAWRDYFMNNLNDIDICDDFDFLTVDRCEEASKVTMMCKNQSRGFTGQTTKWVEEWINNTETSGVNTGTRNNAILIEKNEEDEIIGIVCVATYGHESKKGPTVWIREVAVNPSYQNKGIGRRLIMKALSYGKKYGATRAFLAADECNDRGIHLYTSIGFEASEDESQIDMLK